MKIKSVVFDLDGTLLNTLDDLADAVNHILVLHGMPQRTITEIRSFVGNGIAKLIERAVPVGTPSDLTAECVSQMTEYYGEHCNIKTAPYPGINNMLDRLAERGIKTAVVTNKWQPAAEILCKEKFGDRLSFVVGATEGLKLKPAPDGVFSAMKAIGAEKDSSVYVGDSDVDMQTAANAGLPAIGVLWGFRDKDALEKYSPFAMAQNCAELEKILLCGEAE